MTRIDPFKSFVVCFDFVAFGRKNKLHQISRENCKKYSPRLVVMRDNELEKSRPRSRSHKFMKRLFCPQMKPWRFEVTRI